MALRLAHAQAKQLLAKTGTRLKDARPRKTRVPRPDFAAGLDTQCKQQGVPVGVGEFRFHSRRRWCFDRSWPAQKVAVEVDGGLFVGGRHNRPLGYTADCRKLAEAAILGWRVLRVPTSMVKSGEAFEYLRRLLGYPPRT